MAPTSTIYLIRHSQAEHNVDLDYSIPDAPLTPLGKKQSATLAPQTQEMQQTVDLLVTSALKRTLQSTRLGFGPAIERLGIENVICLPEAQECNDFPCDTGSPREVLEADPELKGFNFDRLKPEWTSKQGFWAPDAASIANRAKSVRQFLRSRPESTIALVAHGDVLRQITADAAGPSTKHWNNAEVRRYKFDEAWVGKDECYLDIGKEELVVSGYGFRSGEGELVKI